MPEILGSPFVSVLAVFIFGFFFTCGAWLANRILGAIFK